MFAAYRPLVSTLAGLMLSNIGLISSNAVEYSIVNKYLLTMAVPLLLFSADLRYAAIRQTSIQAAVQVTAALQHQTWHRLIPHKCNGRLYAPSCRLTGGYLRTQAVCLWLSWWDQLLQLLGPWLLSRRCLSWTWVWMAGRYSTLVLPSVAANKAIVICAAVSVITKYAY